MHHKYSQTVSKTFCLKFSEDLAFFPAYRKQLVCVWRLGLAFSLSEDAADCWLAKNGKPEEVYATVELLLDENRNPNVNITGDPALRAEKIRACVEKAGNWAEE